MKLFGKEFKPFDFNKDGKGVKKEPDSPKNLANFFKHLKNRFTRLVGVNLFIVLGNFPLLFIFLAGLLTRTSTAPAFKMFAPLYGVMTHEVSPVTAALFGIWGTQAEIAVPTTLTYVLYALSALVIFTFGYVNTGTTYILRNMIKGEPIFMWDDFWYAIKRNKRQGMIMGILDVLISFVCLYDIVFFYYNTGASAMMNFMFYASLLIALLWMWMRFYIYILMVTFDLSIFKILKNALIFAFLGLKRNLMATLGIAACCVITFFIMAYIMYMGILIPLFALFGVSSFMACYAAFPKIKQHMIDPYYKEEAPKDTEEPIFEDLG